MALILLGCSHRENSSTPVLAQKLAFEPTTQIFETSQGPRIELVLKEDDHDQKENVGIPESSFRGHTTSFYQDVATKRVLAESGISKDTAWQLKNVEIREARNGTVLISEDLSDALPAFRYILITRDSVQYLAPDTDPPTGNNFRGPEYQPLQLLQNGNLKNGKKEESVDSITRSTQAFSIGG